MYTNNSPQYLDLIRRPKEVVRNRREISIDTTPRDTQKSSRKHSRRMSTDSVGSPVKEYVKEPQDKGRITSSVSRVNLVTSVISRLFKSFTRKFSRQDEAILPVHGTLSARGCKIRPIALIVSIVFAFTLFLFFRMGMVYSMMHTDHNPVVKVHRPIQVQATDVTAHTHKPFRYSSQFRVKLDYSSVCVNSAPAVITWKYPSNNSRMIPHMSRSLRNGYDICCSLGVESNVSWNSKYYCGNDCSNTIHCSIKDKRQIICRADASYMDISSESGPSDLNEPKICSIPNVRHVDVTCKLMY